MPLSDKTAKMLRADLTDARAAWIDEAPYDKERERREHSSFLAYRDEAGSVTDFHALRHTFITNLARGGVHPKQAQDLARHSDINLTMSRYSHTVLADQAAALSALPDLSGGDSDRQEQRATGTCDVVPKSLPSGLPKSLPTRAASIPSPVASQCTKAGNDAGRSHRETPTEQGVSCTSVHRVAPRCVNEVSQPPVGFEPTTCGLQNRCSAN